MPEPSSTTRAPFTPTTGLPGLDTVLCGVARGDNIVWQIQNISDYQALVAPYAAAARAARRRLIYFRFARHAPLVSEGDGAEFHHPRPEDGFESFVDQVHRVIEEAGRETIYIFDCLSDLADTWRSDRLVASFFRLTCPRLYDLDTVTYFGILRNTHMRAAIQVITDTTQFLLDVFACRSRLYIRPIKVQHRSSAAMNLIHAWDGETFRPVKDSATVCEILAGSEWPGLEAQTHIGHWRRMFDAARAVAQAGKDGRPDPAAEAAHFDLLSGLALTDDPAMRRLAAQYLDLHDLLAVRDRMIGNGAIGGKSVGMLLARAILRKDEPLLNPRQEAQDSFYVGSLVFHHFLVMNGLWWIRRRQREPSTFLTGLEEARELILGGQFPPDIIDQFESMLDYFGEWPFIVRSSSLLEDHYGNAFAGQYDSVFCVNQGPRETRMAGLLDAVRRVYASTLSEKALRYRERRGLLDRDEHMALLIMRVSGTTRGRYFHPHAAGVGMSVNPYPWNPRIDMRAGVVRLVAGLGTRAVDRHDDDYTRLMALNTPGLRPENNFGAIVKYAQRRMDALDFDQNRVVAAPLDEIIGDGRDFPLDLFISHEGHDSPAILTFDGLLERTTLVADLRFILGRLHRAYDHPVEIEFALNFLPDGTYRFNLLQCRPMQIRGFEGGALTADPPAGAARRIVAQGAVIGPGRVLPLSRIVYVIPDVYAGLSQGERYEIARVIGKINHASRDQNVLLLGPGRWGTRDPWLGIPISFAEINRVSALGEIVAMRAELIPDVSLGTHFINELVEADMLYFALFPRQPGNLIDEASILREPNRLASLVPGAAKWEHAVRIFDPAPGTWTLHADAMRQCVTVVAEES